MSGEKEEFDPRIHLIQDGDDEEDRKPSARTSIRSAREVEDIQLASATGSGDPYEEYPSDTVVTTAAAAAPAEDDEDTDEALARRLQEEMEEQERMSHQRPRNNEDEDAALARRLMEQGSFGALQDSVGLELGGLPENGVGAGSTRPTRSSGRGGGDESSLELARRLQREQLSGPLGSADEALARQLFEESLMNLTGGENLQSFAASGAGRESVSELPNIPGESDEELAKRYFQESMRALASSTVAGTSGVEPDAADSDEALARRLQAQQLREGARPSLTATNPQRARNPNSASMQEEDQALARRLMEEGLDELRTGQRNAVFSGNLGEEGGVPSARAQDAGTLEGNSSGSPEYKRMARLRQEQEDELLARQFAQDTGDRTRPGARQVNVPATLAPQAAVTRVRAAPTSRPTPPQRSSPTRNIAPTAASGGTSIQTSVPVLQHPAHTNVAPLSVVEQAPSENVSGADKSKKPNRASLFSKLKNRGKQGEGGPSPPLPIPPPPARPQRTGGRPGPFPHSVSISQMLPIASHPQEGRAPGGKANIPRATAVGRATAGASTPNGGVGRTSKSSSTPICCVCKKAAPSYLSTLGKKYHPECFRCMGCHEPIDHSAPFAYTVGDGGQKHPLHRKCYAELFGIKCAVCRRSIPTGTDGKVSYVKHPFFDKERMCPRHAQNPGRRCTGCHRFEPEGDGFADLGDAGRCVCMSCCRSVIVDSSDAKPLWGMVVRFFEDVLSLPLWGSMRDTPVLVVGYDALNDQLQSAGGAHSGSSQIMTRGLCLSEHQSGRRIPVQRMHYDIDSCRFLAGDEEDKGFTFFQVPDPSKINPNSSVTAILCLSGLPRDLTASILAHEATHAWFKLHPNFNVRSPIPLQVEEGCCQLMAYLFLQYLDSQGVAEGHTPSTDRSTGSGSKTDGPTDEQLRQYFKFSIETDESEAYGFGYRMAAQAYSAIGIEALMSHVVMYRKFPDV